ncbi:hypothetical protein M8J76_015279 [Diaphorina citri]|nr:hypothetical protein M8J76_015279 [Diaphorina citri]
MNLLHLTSTLLIGDNLRRKRSRSTPTPSERSRSPVEPRPLNLQEFEELNTNEALVWLNSGTDPWTTVVAKWKETSANRMGIITSTDSPLLLHDYFNQFPALKQVNG